MNEMYIVTSGGLYGHWGVGETKTLAINNWRKAGGKKSEGCYRIQKFVSDLPFAPRDRAATEQEADAWVGRDGSTNWVRCHREKDTVG